MRARISKIMGFGTPPDGLTTEEKSIEKLIGMHAVEGLYNKLPTNRMKAIVALHFELGYSQEICANVFQVSQGRISQEINDIKSIFLEKAQRPEWGRTAIKNPLNYRPQKKTLLDQPKIIKTILLLNE